MALSWPSDEEEATATRAVLRLALLPEVRRARFAFTGRDNGDRGEFEIVGGNLDGTCFGQTLWTDPETGEEAGMCGGGRRASYH